MLALSKFGLLGRVLIASVLLAGCMLTSIPPESSIGTDGKAKFSGGELRIDAQVTNIGQEELCLIGIGAYPASTSQIFRIAHFEKISATAPEIEIVGKNYKAVVFSPNDTLTVSATYVPMSISEVLDIPILGLSANEERRVQADYEKFLPVGEYDIVIEFSYLVCDAPNTSGKLQQGELIYQQIGFDQLKATISQKRVLDRVVVRHPK